jgi:lipoyl(octanoyl) transferase
MIVTDLGTMPYRDAWREQERVHEAVVGGGPERLLLVEHPPVITFGRRAGVERNLLASDEQLAMLGVEVVQSDRGGDITFHGPGQIVAYPIVRLNDHGLSVGAYVQTLERAVMAALGDLGIPARKDDCAVGVWVDDGSGTNTLAKVCAIGVRIRRGVSLHGLALNVTTDLNCFNLIVPCGLHCRPVTSVSMILREKVTRLEDVRRALTARLLGAFEGGIGCEARRSSSEPGRVGPVGAQLRSEH